MILWLHLFIVSDPVSAQHKQPKTIYCVWVQPNWFVCDIWVAYASSVQHLCCCEYIQYIIQHKAMQSVDPVRRLMIDVVPSKSCDSVLIQRVLLNLWIQRYIAIEHCVSPVQCFMILWVKCRPSIYLQVFLWKVVDAIQQYDLCEYDLYGPASFNVNLWRCPAHCLSSVSAAYGPVYYNMMSVNRMGTVQRVQCDPVRASSTLFMVLWVQHTVQRLTMWPC